MNSLWILISAAVFFILGYRFYAKKIERIWQINPQRQTPASVKYDGLDYVPAQNWLVLFGHHFASIAGAGPIIGPAIGVCYWGWGPALIWILLGSVFIGGVHDFGAVITSVREEGATIGDIAARSISGRAKLILSIFTWLALILVIAVFAYLGAGTLVSQPEIVLPSFGIIPIAMGVGWALYRLKWNPLAVTVVGLGLLGVLLYYGNMLPLAFNNGQTLWIVILLVYCFFASILPVNLLLQPRDYLSSFLLVIGIVMGVVGIFLSHPNMNSPAFVTHHSALGPLWPMMFITVACGAVSGFHSLVGSGTTSKQLANERHARRIGYGGMLMEGFLATIVIIAVVGGLSSAELTRHIADKTSPVDLFGLGFGNICASFLGPYGTFLALTILNVFILTTLDSATRITRYITEELFGFKNRFGATGLVVFLAGTLALGKDTSQNPLWQKIWPAFGASNQLVAALALLVISAWLLSKKRPTLYVLIPGIFMLLTSLAALVIQTQTYIKNKDFTLIVISVILFASALFLLKEAGQTYFRNRSKKDF